MPDVLEQVAQDANAVPGAGQQGAAPSGMDARDVDGGAAPPSNVEATVPAGVTQTTAAPDTSAPELVAKESPSQASVPPVDATGDSLQGSLVAGRYRVQQRLGQGGMGCVHKAEQLPLCRPVALKVLRPAPGEAVDVEEQQRFFLEASVVSKLTHPNTITIFDYGQDGDTLFMAMEYLPGQTLSQALLKDGPFQCVRALHVAMQVAKSVREAHVMGLIHRDLKPANIMLVDHEEDRDFAKVLDFGLVKLVEKPEGATAREPGTMGNFQGSPKYASPEQIKNEAPDARSDVYSLGIILYQLVTGHPPFIHEDPIKVLLMHLHDAPLPPSQAAPQQRIPPVMDALILRCLAKERAQRFPTMDAFLNACRTARTQIAPQRSLIPEASLSQPLRAPPPPQRHQTGMVPAVLSAVAAACVGVGLAAWLTMPAAPPPPPPVPPPVTVPMTVDSLPQGANVYLGNVLLGVTPLETRVPSPLNGAALRLELAGHAPVTVDAQLQPAGAHVWVVMEGVGAH